MDHPKKPNIVFLTFDSVRSDRVGFLGYQKNTTPFLDSLAANGIFFKEAFSAGAGSPQSFVSMFTSTYPMSHGGYSYVDKPRVILSEALQADGYRTVGIHSSPYLSSYFGYDRGWDEYAYLTYFRANKKGQAKRSGQAPMSAGLRKDTAKARVLRESASTYRWLKENIPPVAVVYKVIEKILLFIRKVLKDIFRFRPAFYTGKEINEEIQRFVPAAPADGQPLFLWAHYLDAHAPYALFAKNEGGLWMKIKFYMCDWLMFLFGDSPAFGKLCVPVFSSMYDASIRYIDEHIKQTLEYLRSIGIDETNTIFVFSADHGEAFYEHGAHGHSQMLFNVNLHVPVLLYAPQYLPAPHGVERPVSLMDIGPTLLKLVGAAIPETYQGKDLLGGEKEDVVAQASESEGDLSGAAKTGVMIIHKGYKLIHWKDKRYLFSMDDEPEENNLYETEDMQHIVRNLEERVKPYEP